MNNKYNFSKAFRTARKQQKKTQSKVAEAVGITDEWYQKVETHRGSPSGNLLVDLAKELDIDVRELELLPGADEKA